MKPERIALVSSLLLLLALIGNVHASNVFEIGPSENVTQEVECPVGCQSIAGNVSTVGGNIDFYVADPSGNIVLCHENISLVRFTVTTPQNGTYVIHLANRLSTNNITATLFYGRNVVINAVLDPGVDMKTWNTVATWTPTLPTPSPVNPWLGPLSQIGSIIFGAVVGPLLVSLLLDLIRHGYQKYKDGESKTPVVAK